MNGRQFLTTTALCALGFFSAPGAAHALCDPSGDSRGAYDCYGPFTPVRPTAAGGIITITTTIQSYDFPDSEPVVSTSTKTENSCGPVYTDLCSDAKNNPPGACRNGSGTGGGSGSGSRVICTHFYQQGELDEMVYFADIEFTRMHLHPAIVCGYHAWGIWYVEQMRKNPGGLLERIMRPIAIHRAQEIAYQMGVMDKPDLGGKLVRVIGEPLCFVFGLLAKEYDWRRLYAASDFRAFADGYRRYQAYKFFRANRAQQGLAQLIHANQLAHVLLRVG